MSSSSQLYPKVWDRISSHSSGCLYDAIRCLLEPDDDLADQVVHKFAIRPDASLEDDLELLSKNSISAAAVVEKSFKASFIHNPTRFLGQPTSYMKKVNNDNKTELIFLGALALIALWYLLWERPRTVATNVSGSRGLDTLPRGKPQPPELKTLSICLVMPQSKVGSITGRGPLSTGDVERLVDGANFFRCVEKREAIDDENQLLQLSDATPDLAANPNIYLRLDISAGEELLEANTQFGLKRRLASAESPTLGRQAMLESVDGLKKFNRI